MTEHFWSQLCVNKVHALFAQCTCIHALPVSQWVNTSSVFLFFNRVDWGEFYYRGMTDSTSTLVRDWLGCRTLPRIPCLFTLMMMRKVHLRIPYKLKTHNFVWQQRNSGLSSQYLTVTQLQTGQSE